MSFLRDVAESQKIPNPQADSVSFRLEGGIRGGPVIQQPQLLGIHQLRSDLATCCPGQVPEH